MKKWMKVCLAGMMVTTLSVVGDMCWTYDYPTENAEYGPENYEGLCKYTFCAYASQLRSCAGFASTGYTDCYDEPYSQPCNVHTATPFSDGSCPDPYQNPEYFEWWDVQNNPVHYDTLYGATCTDA